MLGPPGCSKGEGGPSVKGLLPRVKQSLRDGNAPADIRLHLMRARVAFAALGLLSAFPVAAESDALVWTAVTANGPLGHGVLFTGDVGARIGSGPQEFRQYLVRAALGAEIAHQVTFHVGYAHF